ncbi:MAG TPA: hypothetical protein VNF04_17305 [Stellaceae bacterium]|nr:hypothetical protein [Stellaceae bacterium]
MAQGSPPDDVVVRGRFPTAGGSGPDDPNVEARLAHLESAVDAIRLDLAEIKGKLSNMPTTFQLVFMQAAIIVTVFAGAIGLSFALLKFASGH